VRAWDVINRSQNGEGAVSFPYHFVVPLGIDSCRLFLPVYIDLARSSSIISDSGVNIGVRIEASGCGWCQILPPEVALFAQGYWGRIYVRFCDMNGDGEKVTVEAGG
jgi:hypothetical protein